MTLSILHSLATVSQISQLPLVLFITYLSYRSIAMLNIKQFIWVCFAFGTNFLYILLTLISDKESILNISTHFSGALFTATASFLNILTSFFFLLAFVLWFTDTKPYNIFQRSKGLTVATYLHILVGTKTRGLLMLFICTAFVLIVSFVSKFNVDFPFYNNISTFYSIGSLFFALLLFRWNTGRYNALQPLTFGFITWGILQVLMPLHYYIGDDLILFIGFSVSLIAKFLILTGLFLWCVDFTGETQRINERNRQEKEQFQKSSDFFKEILSQTFHEITGPIKDLEKSIEALALNIPRTSRPFKEKVDSDYERVKAIITISKNSYDHDIRELDDEDEILNFHNDYHKIVNINTVLESACTSIKNFYRPLHIEFIKDYSAKCYIECSQNEVIQLFRNLLKNSVESYRDGNPIKIKIRSALNKESGKSIVVEIEDYGKGIESSIAHEIWNSGFSTKEKDEVNSIRGQGLHVVKEIISHHPGATISMESPIKRGEVGSISGTKFIVEFTKYELKNK